MPGSSRSWCCRRRICGRFPTSSRRTGRSAALRRAISSRTDRSGPSASRTCCCPYGESWSRSHSGGCSACSRSSSSNALASIRSAVSKPSVSHAQTPASRGNRTDIALATVHDPYRLAGGPGQLTFLEHSDLRAQIEKLFERVAQAGQRGLVEALTGLEQEGEPVTALQGAVEHDLVLVPDSRVLEHQRFDLAWIEVDAAEDDHVVGAPPNPVQAQMGAPTRAAAPAQHPREVVRAVTDQRQPFAGEGAHHELPLLAVRARGSRGRIHHLAEVVVLPDVDAVARPAVDAEPGPARLRHAEDVEGVDVKLALDPPAQIVGPHLRTEDGHAEAEGGEVELLLARHFEHAQWIRRDAREHRGAQVAHDLKL